MSSASGKAVAEISFKLYAKLDEQSKDEEVAGVLVRVFRGGMLTTFETVTKARRYYVPSFAVLELASAITILERGNRYATTLILLHGAPTKAALEEIAPEGLTNGASAATLALEQKVNGILKTYGGIDIKQAFADHEKRLRAIEQKLSASK